MAESRSTPLYLDYHATTPVDPRVVDVMLPFFARSFGNPASVDNAHGLEASEAVESARRRIGGCIGAGPDELIFTAGATESNNLAILGVARALADQGDHVVTCATEHSSVLAVCDELMASGINVTVLPVDSTGTVLLEELEKAVRPNTILVSIMLANNEIGTIAPMPEIAELVHNRGVLLHSDITQAVGHIPVDVHRLGLDLASFSAHKFYGPKGVGALFVRKRSPRVRIHPLIRGGGQEHGIRSGTLNVPGIVGMASALELACTSMAAELPRLRRMADETWARLAAFPGGVERLGHPENRLPHNLSLRFCGARAKSLRASLQDISFSTGSACAALKSEESHVLAAIGFDKDAAREVVRLSLGRWTTPEDLAYVCQRFAEVVPRLRGLV